MEQEDGDGDDKDVDTDVSCGAGSGEHEDVHGDGKAFHCELRLGWRKFCSEENLLDRFQPHKTMFTTQLNTQAATVNTTTNHQYTFNLLDISLSKLRKAARKDALMI